MTTFKHHLSGLEFEFIQSLKNICNSSLDVTNLFIFGSLVQNTNKYDAYSDLDIIILTKENQNLPINLSQFVSFFASHNSQQWKEFNYVLNNFHCGNMIVSTEEYFKKVIEDNPFFFGSVVSKNIKQLVIKNDFLSNIKIKLADISLNTYISDIFLNKYIYDFINLLRMKQRKEKSKIYFYSNELINSLRDLMLKKMQYEKYLEYKKNPKNIYSILKDYEGGHFERYASSRQLKIMDMFYQMINLSPQNMLELFDLIYEEVKDFIKLINLDSKMQKLDIMRLYMVSSLFNTSDFNDYLTQQDASSTQAKKLLTIFTDN